MIIDTISTDHFRAYQGLIHQKKHLICKKYTILTVKFAIFLLLYIVICQWLKIPINAPIFQNRIYSLIINVRMCKKTMKKNQPQYQAYLFNKSHISEALGKRVISIGDISAKVSSDGLYADIVAVCKSEYSSLLKVTKKENIMRIKAKECHQFTQFAYAIDGDQCRVIALIKPINPATTSSRAMQSQAMLQNIFHTKQYTPSTTKNIVQRTQV